MGNNEIYSNEKGIIYLFIYFVNVSSNLLHMPTSLKVPFFQNGKVMRRYNFKELQGQTSVPIVPIIIVNQQKYATSNVPGQTAHFTTAQPRTHAACTTDISCNTCSEHSDNNILCSFHLEHCDAEPKQTKQFLIQLKSSNQTGTKTIYTGVKNKPTKILHPIYLICILINYINVPFFCSLLF